MYEPSGLNPHPFGYPDPCSLRRLVCWTKNDYPPVATRKRTVQRLRCRKLDLGQERIEMRAFVICYLIAVFFSGLCAGTIHTDYFSAKIS